VSGATSQGRGRGRPKGSKNRVHAANGTAKRQQGGSKRRAQPKTFKKSAKRQADGTESEPDSIPESDSDGDAPPEDEHVSREVCEAPPKGSGHVQVGLVLWPGISMQPCFMALGPGHLSNAIQPMQ
jgi:hypothetical protein